MKRHPPWRIKAVFVFVTAALMSVPLLFHVYATSTAPTAEVQSVHDHRQVVETAKLKIITLPVQVKLPDTSSFIDASDGMDIPLGTTIKTGKTRAGIVYPSGTTTRLDHDTTIILKEFDLGPQQITVEILNGRIWSRVKKLMGNESYETEVQGVTATVRGTAYEHSATEGVSLTRVVEGLVEVTCNDASIQTKIAASQKGTTDCTLPQEQTVVQPLSTQDAEDEWIQFNATIDNLPVVTPSVNPQKTVIPPGARGSGSVKHPTQTYQPAAPQNTLHTEERADNTEYSPLPTAFPVHPTTPPVLPTSPPTQGSQPSPPVSVDIGNGGVGVGVQLPGVNVEVGIGRGKGNANGREGGNGECNGKGNPNCKGKNNGGGNDDDEGDDEGEDD